MSTSTPPDPARTQPSGPSRAPRSSAHRYRRVGAPAAIVVALLVAPAVAGAADLDGPPAGGRPSVASTAIGGPSATALRGPATSVRSDGRTLRFVDRRVRRVTQTLSGELLGVSEGRVRWVVQTASGRQVAVRFGGRGLPARAVGSRVRVRATSSGAVRTATAVAPLRRAITATPTAHRAYVFLVTGKGAFGSTDATILATVDRALDRWREESNGAITSFQRVDGSRTLATATDCQSGSAMYNEAAAQLPAGVTTGSTSGNHVIVIAPPGCAGGVGTVQAGINSGGRLNAAWNPRSTLHTLMHELGHNMSLQHANACYEPLGPGCVVQEYANTYAVMGFTLSNDPPYTPAALDSFERSRLGITDTGEVAAVTLGAGQRATTGTWDLRARGTASGLRGLRVTDPTTGTIYSVDWRSGGGRDALSGYALNPVKDNYGVTVERLAPDGRSAAVLGHPNPVAGRQPLFGLTAGRSFTAGGTTITVQSTGDRNDPSATSRVGVTLTDPSVAPDTSITGGPAEGATVAPDAVSFAFAGTPADAVAGFDCQVDGGAWAACSSAAPVAGLADGSHVFRVRARDAANLVDASPATRSFAVGRPVPAGGAAPGAAAPGASTTPGGPTTTPGGSPEAARPTLDPAKLEVTRATVSSSRRRFSLVAPITARASGTVRVTLRAAGRTTTFDAPVDARRRRVVLDRRIPASQARAGTGIVTLTYRGDADTQPQVVRLRAATRPAGLRAGRPTVTDGRLRASGRIDRRARGVVRVQVLFEPASGATRTLRFTARVSAGRYRLDRALPADVRAAVGARRGVVHSYTLFTGDQGRRLRGELASYEVLGAR